MRDRRLTCWPTGPILKVQPYKLNRQRVESVRYFLPILVFVVFVDFSSARDVVVFTDGSRMEVQSYEVERALVVLISIKGKLFSVPASRVNLEATDRVNQRVTQPAYESPPDPAPVDSTDSPAFPDVTEPEAHLARPLDPAAGSFETPHDIAPTATTAAPAKKTAATALLPLATKAHPGSSVDLPLASHESRRGEERAWQALELFGVTSLVSRLSSEAASIGSQMKHIWPGAEPEAYRDARETLVRAFAAESMD